MEAETSSIVKYKLVESKKHSDLNRSPLSFIHGMVQPIGGPRSIQASAVSLNLEGQLDELNEIGTLPYLSSYDSK